MFGGLTTACRRTNQSPGVLLSSMCDCHNSACSVSERAKLYAVACCLLPALSACARDRVTPVYDPAGTIRRLDYDIDHDDDVDMRAYLERGRTVRIEADGNGDGIVDRWEYYGTDGHLERIGWPRRHLGRAERRPDARRHLDAARWRRRPPRVSRQRDAGPRRAGHQRRRTNGPVAALRRRQAPRVAHRHLAEDRAS